MGIIAKNNGRDDLTRLQAYINFLIIRLPHVHLLL